MAGDNGKNIKEQAHNPPEESEVQKSAGVDTNAGTATPKKTKKYDLDSFNDIWEYLQQGSNRVERLRLMRKAAGKHLARKISMAGLESGTKVLFIYQEDDENIGSLTLDSIYSKVSSFDKTKRLLLILHSSGGRIEPAYLISKGCKQYSSEFAIAVPRRAKSAATLIALGADEIHMGDVSELGPIDPQIGGLPALALSNAIEVVAGIAARHPGSSEMFASYLSNKLNLQNLGYFERVAESAIDYGIRLLGKKNLPKTGREIATELVKSYKDHGFVIDKEEAKKLLGDMIKSDTPEYFLANDIARFIANTKLALWVTDPDDREYTFSIVGDCNSIRIARKNKEE